MVKHHVTALDDPVGNALRGAHAHLSRRVGSAMTYQPGVATFVALEPGSEHGERWNELAELLGPGGFADMFSSTATPPSGWEQVFEVEGRQMIGPPEPPQSVAGVSIELGAEDVPEMLELVRRTSPGPFGPRTHELGTYLGVRDNGELVAMAGERLRPPGWAEISAVCTVPESRGRGYAALLVTELVRGIHARGERPFLHATETNTAAIALYERLGFRTRKHVTFRGFQVP